ncbi:hypothetical protein GE300_00925 [Rhodobacteraceae bacterium 2CG4]|uniref:Uncharacterized protein n=1 Tax=Halovulum marinum TaxID=2662447 RepID=A0A6L5YUR8_9RHOB|nr:hypothetical protein [Halovulum marinum]MSU88176.1 hypothetical protein [Halovulum marinum]
MNIRKEIASVLIVGSLLILATIALMIVYCFAVSNRGVHLTVVAILTTSGPLVARVFEGLVRRRQIVRGVDRNCLAAEDEVLISRTLPLVMPVVGAIFAYAVML